MSSNKNVFKFCTNVTFVYSQAKFVVGNTDVFDEVNGTDNDKM